MEMTEASGLFLFHHHVSDEEVEAWGSGLMSRKWPSQISCHDPPLQTLTNATAVLAGVQSHTMLANTHFYFSLGISDGINLCPYEHIIGSLFCSWLLYP